MKRVAVLLTMVLSTFVSFVSAQDAAKGTEVKSKYGDNWFISLGGSANLLNAEQDKLAKYTDRITFGGELTAGKWFTADFGMRAQFSAGALRGFNAADTRFYESNIARCFDPMRDPSNGTGLFVYRTGMHHRPVPQGYRTIDIGNYGKNGQEGFWQEYNYGTFTVDLMANLTNLSRGYYAEKGKFDIVGFAGLGLVGALDNGVTNPDFYYLIAKVGLQANYNITPKWAIYLEPKFNITSPEFDGYAGDAMGDAMTNLTLGVKYTFNRNFDRNYGGLSPEELDALNQRINDNRDKINDLQNGLNDHDGRLDQLEGKVKDIEDKPVPPPVVEKKKLLPTYVRFLLDSYVIQPSEYGKIEIILQFLKEYPEANILLVGYADVKTAYPSYNLRLSEKRVKAVANELKRLGVDGNRIAVDWKGDTVQPFEINEWNRVVLVVEK